MPNIGEFSTVKHGRFYFLLFEICGKLIKIQDFNYWKKVNFMSDLSQTCQIRGNP